MTFDGYANSPARSEPGVPVVPSADIKPGSSLMARRGLVTAATIALSAIAGIGMAHVASAKERTTTPKEPQPTSTTFDQALWDRQGRLSDLSHWIDAQPGIKTSGYVTSINDPDAGSTILVWHGPSDSMQRQIMDECRRRNIPVSIQQRKHSMNDLEQAASQLAAIDPGTGAFQNFTVSTIGTIDIDFDGVTVSGDYIRPPAEGIAAADTALAQALTAKTGVVVRIEHGKLVPHGF